MIKIIHRVNKVENLKRLSYDHGVEIDIRTNNGSLVLAHDISNSADLFEDYLESYNHQLLVANIKEAGIEKKVIKKLIDRGISKFFLLDTEFPFIINNYEEYGDVLSLRYSKLESIKTIENFIGKVKWVWVDTYEDFEINQEITKVLKNFSICLVSPSRWGKKEELNYFIEKFSKYNLAINGVMIEEGEI